MTVQTFRSPPTDSGAEKERKQMKKLLVAAAMVCAAAFVHAATVNWGVSMDFQDTNFENIEGVFSVLDVTTDNQYDFTLVDGHAEGTATITEGGLVKTILTISNFDGQSGSFANESSFTFVNPKPGYADTEGSLGSYADDMLAAHTNDGLLDLYADPTSQGYSPVPEPTSGLLLLLGMAGLALRRRRA